MVYTATVHGLRFYFDNLSFDNPPDAETIQQLERSTLFYGELARLLKRRIRGGEQYPHFDDILDSVRHARAGNITELTEYMERERGYLISRLDSDGRPIERKRAEARLNGLNDEFFVLSEI